ncbi:uncharacterized protein Pyn_37287 [Prunus yedoensis var. nudiflora]|uniref:Uncharacterized protein n=1 Tax=Prunus yedoensis var. nudiflora TaxID=2094558 RepID=A0A314UEW7_PRUYE|nr:uncharacterized protein Pyn_37287 [Prunus yedoensis var. nudiflora]
MALNEHQGSESGPDPEELEVLECEVKEMAEKILEYRATLPDQLKNTFASILAAQKPDFLNVRILGLSELRIRGCWIMNAVVLRSD